MIPKKKKKVFGLDHHRIKFQESGLQMGFALNKIVLTVMLGLGLD